MSPSFAISLALRTESPEKLRKVFDEHPLLLAELYADAAENGFTLTDTIRGAIRESACDLKYADPSRVGQVLLDVAETSSAAKIFRWMMEDGVLQQIIPEIGIQVGYDQWTTNHAMPLWEHTLATVQRAQELTRDPHVVLAALLHDLGKPSVATCVYRCEKCGETREEPREGEIQKISNCFGNELACGFATTHFEHCRYEDHGQYGAQLVNNRLYWLDFDPKEAQVIAWLVAHHDIPFNAEWTPESAKEFAEKHGTLLEAVLMLARADRLAHAPWRRSTHSLDQLAELLKED